MKVVASIFDVVIINRWNKSIGVSDHAAFMIGDNILYKVRHMATFTCHISCFIHSFLFTVFYVEHTHTHTHRWRT